MSQKLAHAKHNESVCNFISRKPDYADWVAITAFYSALHFVDHKIFPLSITDTSGKKIVLPTLERYCMHLGRHDKHATRTMLVHSECPTISAAFKWLHDTCWLARYTNYKFAKPRETATAAKEYLQEIKTFCLS